VQLVSQHMLVGRVSLVQLDNSRSLVVLALIALRSLAVSKVHLVVSLAVSVKLRCLVVNVLIVAPMVKLGAMPSNCARFVQQVLWLSVVLPVVHVVHLVITHHKPWVHASRTIVLEE